MGNRCSTFGDGNVHHALSDQRTGNACSEQILAFIQRTRLEHRIDEVIRELVAQIVDVDLRCAGCQRFFLQTVKLFLLADIGGEGDNLRIIGFFQPFQDD
ncbi:hypothetical protein D3C86_1544780 [compost metagenome]